MENIFSVLQYRLSLSLEIKPFSLSVSLVSPPQCSVQTRLGSVQCSSPVSPHQPRSPRAVRVIGVAPRWAGSAWLCFSGGFSSPSWVCRWRSAPRTCASSCCATPPRRRCCTCSPRCVRSGGSLDQSPSAGGGGGDEG